MSESKNDVIFTQWNTIAERKKELPPFMTTWMELENIMLSEISQVAKNQNHMLLNVLLQSRKKVIKKQ